MNNSIKFCFSRFTTGM
ncbi:hypothetical protein ABD479_002507 [Salmonella enterica subsp. enterica serovar Infantis]|uniref:Peptide IlvX n=43 Tax=Salmonella enterica TaxID=28901 RepID=A0A8F7NCQ0_SALER|nr:MULTISPECIES: peptide IlvX [Salmonella]EHJ4342505.1 hypothetical protein [Salmonella enterica subsp. enterica serovar Soerenga]EHJ4421228.1 hypothetical protein [Salmonella enterica subsp. enterica serovar 4,[5],12:b:-]EHJ5083910.1 hypothetical protein [Salmonella enterica subsp. enterica serovar 47:z4,z23:-]EHJ5407057.1 hypothetical protein [Salmonella enterica subsp. enterica serovar Wedding]EHJ6409154.1 hypothetical protein [Salmonella enterica subsp. enterica serovar 6,7,[14]:r:-]EHJ71